MSANTNYAKITEVKRGDVLIADGGFSCIRPNSNCRVDADGHGLFVRCDDGSHYLDGQLGNGDRLIGFTKRVQS